MAEGRKGHAPLPVLAEKGEIMSNVQEYDHELFEEIVQGLCTQGWKQEGGSPTFRLLNKGDVGIKVSRLRLCGRHTQTITIAWTAPPEEEKE